MRLLSRFLSSVAILSVLGSTTAIAGTAPTNSRLAWFSGGKLEMGFVAGRYSTLAPRHGSVFRPAFSYDGRYLAFLWQTPPATSSVPPGPGYLWLSRFCVNVPALPPPRNCDPHQITSIGPVTSFTWSPTADELAVQTESGANLLLNWNGVIARLPSGRVSGLPAWSADGRMLAISVTSRQGYSRLYLIAGRYTSSRSFPGIARYSVPVLAEWWGASDLLYWIDPDASASMAADGMHLIDLRLRSGRTRDLGVMLGYRDWLAISGRRLLMVKGGGRSAFLGKHLQLCSLGGSCHIISGIPKGKISDDPTWSPDGRHIAFIVARAWTTYGFVSGPRYRSWLNSHVLWIANGDGAGAHPVARVPHGAADPQWTRDGRWLLFERGGSLWLISRVGAGNAQPLVVLTKNLIPDPNHPAYQGWYYGHMNWHHLFALY